MLNWFPESFCLVTYKDNNKPFLSISHTNRSHGKKPTGPQMTKIAISVDEKPKACLAEFWMGPHVFHTIPCKNERSENKINTSHLLLYTLPLLIPGWSLCSASFGSSNGSLSLSVLPTAPIDLTHNPFSLRSVITCLRWNSKQKLHKHLFTGRFHKRKQQLIEVSSILTLLRMRLI